MQRESYLENIPLFQVGYKHLSLVGYKNSSFHLYISLVVYYYLTMRKDTENFIASAEYDINTAEHMLKTGRYIYVIFMCHLSIEKMLKALSSEVTGKTPPRTHNLIYLTKLSGINFSENHFEFVAKLNNASVVTRYPEDFKNSWKPILRTSLSLI